MAKTWIVRRWRSVLGGLGLLEVAWRAIAWTLSTLGNIDFVVTHVKEPGWVGQVMAFIINPPGWFLLIALASGFALLFWDMRRSSISAAITRDVWLSNALWRVAIGRWARPDLEGQPTDAKTRAHLELAAIRIRQAARERAIPIWHLHQKIGLYKPTPQSLWDRAELDLQTVIGRAPPDMKYVYRDSANKVVLVPDPRFMTSQKAVETWLAREGTHKAL